MNSQQILVEALREVVKALAHKKFDLFDPQPRLAETLDQARAELESLPTRVLEAYERSLDNLDWAALTAWFMFTTGTGDLQVAIERIDRYATSVLVARGLNFSAKEAAWLITSTHEVELDHLLD